jgi:hypothetical protein
LPKDRDGAPPSPRRIDSLRQAEGALPQDRGEDIPRGTSRTLACTSGIP